MERSNIGRYPSLRSWSSSLVGAVSLMVRPMKDAAVAARNTYSIVTDAV
jgi:hypothetical protein